MFLPLFSNLRSKIQQFKLSLFNDFNLYHKNLFKNINKNAIWPLVNEITRNRNEWNALSVNDRVIISPEHIANVFNSYFSSIFVSDNELFPDIQVSYRTELTNVTFTSSKISKVIKSLPNKTSLGPDSIPIFTVKKLIIPFLIC